MYSGKTIPVTNFVTVPCENAGSVLASLQGCSDSNWQLALSLNIIGKCAFHSKFFQCNILGDSKYVSLWREISMHKIGLCCFMEWEEWLIWLQFNQPSVNVYCEILLGHVTVIILPSSHAQSPISKLFSIVNNWPNLILHHFAACVVICVSKKGVCSVVISIWNILQMFSLWCSEINYFTRYQTGLIPTWAFQSWGSIFPHYCSSSRWGFLLKYSRTVK